MIYENMAEAVFISRPNRFIANIDLRGRETVCHVKNTGRCKELLIPGAKILVQEFDSEKRKTSCDLISVWKGERLVNMDSNAPNKVFGEWLRAGGLGFVPEVIKSEYTHEDSRFDFYFEHQGKKALAEIKGVTLEDAGVVRFPDAPTERGLKHLRGLMRAVEQGFETYAVFVIQMHGVKYFEPNRATHPEFAQVLKQARDAGVHIMALDCRVTESNLSIDSEVKVQI